MTIRGGAIAAGLLAAALIPLQPSFAGPFYFHKADVDRELFVAEYAECDELATGVKAPRYQVYSPTIYAAAAGSFFAGFFGSREKRHMMNNVLRTCMADKGYRRVEPTDEIKKQLGKLDDEERVDRLFSLASSPEPEGKVLPR
jgi:hypothetical protein